MTDSIPLHEHGKHAYEVWCRAEPGNYPLFEALPDAEKRRWAWLAKGGLATDDRIYLSEPADVAKFGDDRQKYPEFFASHPDGVSMLEWDAYIWGYKFSGDGENGDDVIVVPYSVMTLEQWREQQRQRVRTHFWQFNKWPERCVSINSLFYRDYVMGWIVDHPKEFLDTLWWKKATVHFDKKPKKPTLKQRLMAGIKASKNL